MKKNIPNIVKNKVKECSLIAVDLDGTLCEGEFWGEGEPLPKKDIIAKVKEMYFKGHHIHIHTARKEIYRPHTTAWLMKHRVWYHSLVMEKMPADLYIDDKTVRPDEFLKMK